jgi:hypothetical protein
LLEVAGRNRGSTDGDGILSIAATLLDVHEHVEDIYKEIAEQTLFKHEEEFVQVATGFRDPDKVAELQEKNASLQSIAASLETVIKNIEEKDWPAKLEPLGSGVLENLINTTLELPNEIARAISRRAA